MPDIRARPAAAGRASATPARRFARVLLAASALFIVYGSLFPFDFAAQPLPLASFLDEHDLFSRRADALENIFLFIPLGIALQAGLARPRARALGALLAVLVLAVGVQLVQLWLPSRTASVSDAVWNTVGMAIGMLAAARVQPWLANLMAARGQGRDNFLLVLVLLWLCYESFPFVPTLDIGLLRAHVKTAVFAPPFEWPRLLQHGVAAALAGIAVMRSGWLRRPWLGVLGLGVLAVGLEVCVAYGQLRRETLLGIVLGLGAGCLAAAGGGRDAAKRAGGLALALALGMYLFTVLTPYRGQGAGEGFTFEPFAYLLDTDSLGGLPPTAYEALALGAILWAGMRLQRGPASVWSVLVLMMVAALEWVRVAVAGYQGDTTPFVLALVLAPCAAALRPAPAQAGRAS